MLRMVIFTRSPNGKFEAPIYVGKAVPAGARKGGFGLGLSPGTVLFKRLEEHAESIRQATNLKLEDFKCRFLVVDDIWIPLAESLLIEMFSPAWNKIVDGFGNHNPGSGRHGQRRSSWDVLHPGRSWADQLTGGNARPVDEIHQLLAAFLQQGPDAVPTTPTNEFVLTEEQLADEDEPNP